MTKDDGSDDLSLQKTAMELLSRGLAHVEQVSGVSVRSTVGHVVIRFLIHDNIDEMVAHFFDAFRLQADSRET